VTLQTELQDATIRAGDYLIGDLNGVVCLPKELAEKAIALMGPQAEADLKIAADLQKGMGFSEASKKHRVGLGKP
jgi:regulator of RNase E activity RraA